MALCIWHLQGINTNSPNERHNINSVLGV